MIDKGADAVQNKESGGKLLKKKPTERRVYKYQR